MKKLEDRYLVIKKEAVDANALSCLMEHLRHNGIVPVEAYVCELEWLGAEDFRNLLIYGTVAGPNLYAQRDIESETITVDRVGDITRSVTERFYRAPVVENRLETTINLGDNFNGESFFKEMTAMSPQTAFDATKPVGKAPHLPCDKAPNGWCCGRERGHIGSCAAYQAPVPSPAPQVVGTADLNPFRTDSEYYAYCMIHGLTVNALANEEKHLLVGYPPEQVSIGLLAIEEGRDPIYAINCHIEKDTSVPQPQMPAPQMPSAEIPPAAPPIGVPVEAYKPPPPIAPTAEWAQPVALPCQVPGCEGFRDMSSPYYCRDHASTQPAPLAPMPEAQTPVKHASWCGEKGSAASCICQAGECAPLAEEEQMPAAVCKQSMCKRDAQEGSDYCYRHQPKE